MFDNLYGFASALMVGAIVTFILLFVAVIFYLAIDEAYHSHKINPQFQIEKGEKQ
jgi:hypothetical protein